MQKVSIVSQKGGSGKSTLSVHLAAEGATRGRKVLLIDLDPQGNAVRWGARRGDAAPDVSAESVAAIDRVLQSAEREGYDLVVFDTAPNADQSALLAARVADVILIPCRPSQFDIEAVRLSLDLCALAQKTGRVVLNAAPVRSRVVSDAQQAIRGHGAVVSPVVVRERVALRHCMPTGQVASELEPGGLAAQEIAALYDDMIECLHVATSTRRHANAVVR